MVDNARARSWKVVAVNPHPEVTFEHEHEALVPLGVEIRRLSVVSEDEFFAHAADADVVIAHRFPLTAGVIARLERCRHLPSGGIGVDHIDVDAATERGILVTNMGDLFVEEVANQTWMLLLLAARRGLWLHEMATTNRWREALDQLFPVLRLSMPRITGQTLGLVSFGRIARAVARRARAFGMEVVAYDPYIPADTFAEHGVERVNLDDVFRRGDFVSCHLPLSAETFHLVGERQFAAMKPSAIFLNTGRGRVVDEAALIAALRAGTLAGAALDVLEQEPPTADNPLLSLPNVILSPHMASVSDVSAVERKRRLGQQVAAVLAGQVPVGVVNPTVLDRWRARVQV